MPERIRIRNTVARSALMRKGGAHIESRSGLRQRSRVTVEDAVEEWYKSSLDVTTDCEWEYECDGSSAAE